MHSVFVAVEAVKSQKIIFRMRSKPYSCSEVKVHLPASVYELRPRNTKTYNVLRFNDPAKDLPPNSAALIGVGVSTAFFCST